MPTYIYCADSWFSHHVLLNTVRCIFSYQNTIFQMDIAERNFEFEDSLSKGEIVEDSLDIEDRHEDSKIIQEIIVEDTLDIEVEDSLDIEDKYEETEDSVYFTSDSSVQPKKKIVNDFDLNEFSDGEYAFEEEEMQQVVRTMLKIYLPNFY